MPSTTFIIATYVIGLIGTAVAWSWDFRWNQEISMAGYLAIVYSITILVLSGQFLLALGAFARLIAAIVYPTVRKYIRQQIRNGRL